MEETRSEEAEVLNREGQDDEVTGYMENWYLRGNLADQHQAERRDEATRERMLRAALPESQEEETEDGGLVKRGFLTVVGFFTMLTSIPQNWPRK